MSANSFGMSIGGVKKWSKKHLNVPKCLSNVSIGQYTRIWASNDTSQTLKIMRIMLESCLIESDLSDIGK